MSAGGAGASRVSIPKNVREMIKTIKEMVGNHSDEEIHAMLKECSMDPNETAQKLLFLDPFHEVKRRRDKRKEVKENMNNRESLDSRRRPGIQGRGGRSGKGNFPSRYTNDPVDGRNMNAGKENGVKQGTERAVIPSSVVVSQETESKPVVSLSSSSYVDNGSINVARGRAPEGQHSGVNPLKKTLLDSDKLGSAHLPSQSPAAKTLTSDVTIQNEQPTPSSDHLASPVSVLGVYSSSSDPVLVPSLDSRIPGTVGTIKREVGSQRIVTESNSLVLGENRSTDTLDLNINRQMNKAVTVDANIHDLSSSANEKASTESASSFMHGKVPSKSQSSERSQSVESSHPMSSSTHGTSNSRPSSNYGNRPQQLVGSQKAVGPNKEWKPKPTNPSSAPASAIVEIGEGGPGTIKAGTQSLPTLSASISAEESASKLQEKLEELHLSHNQHVIIPNHLQVPEAERTGLCFGSFGANFEVKRSYNDHDTEKIATPLSESSQEPEETTEEPFSSQIESSPTRAGDYSDHPPSPKNVPDNLSPVEADVSSSAAHEYDQSKSETVSPLGDPQFSVVHTAPNYTIGLMPPILGTQFAPFDTSESQARDVSRLPNFVVQQPFDPSSYYPHVYRPSGDGDGRFSPFIAPGASNKYNGNIAVQSGQPQESGNSLVPSTAAPTSLVTQTAGVMQSTLAVTQQPVPIFRQPAGVHLPHYPPNYIPYSQYFSPIYLPPQTIHHYLANPAFPQQPPTGSVYPPSGAAATAGVKYSQYKPVANTGNSTHVGMPSGYAPYSSSQTGYSPSPATTTPNSNGNEDLSAPQYKENNVYITGQQSEGPAVWIPAPARDVSGLSASSFYSLSPQGQHVTFTPTQAGHGAFTGIYHPSQTMAATTVHPILQQSQSHGGPVEMVGTPAGVFQQTQRAQINWTNNY